MAFNPIPQSQPPASYVGMSQGIRSDRDTSLATLFEGLADGLQMGVQTADQAVKDRIEDDIFESVEAIQDEFGVGSATEFEADAEGPQPVPHELANAHKHLQGLQTAHQRGVLKESHYWARLNSMVRQLRSRYPGYRSEIDQMVQGITGSRPANALRAALFREWGAAAEEDPLVKLEDWASKQGHLPTDYHERAMAGNPYSMTELQAYVARRTRAAADSAARRADMAEAEAQGSLTENQALRNFRVETNQAMQTLLEDMSQTVGTNYAEVQSRIREAQRMAAAGTPMDATELQQLSAMMGELRQEARMALHALAMEQHDDNPMHRYGAYLDESQIEATINQALTPITLMEEALSSDNPWGVLGSVQAWVDAQKTQAGRELLEGVPVMARLQALHDMVGADVTWLYLDTAPQVLSSLSASLLAYHQAGFATGESTASDAIVQAQEKFGEDSREAREIVKGMMEGWRNTLVKFESGELSDPDMLTNVVRSLFGSDAREVFASIHADDQVEYFKRMASPENTKRMKKLRDAGHEDAWEMYERWMASAFVATVRQDVQNLQRAATHPRDIVEVRWDPQRLRFDMKWNHAYEDYLGQAEIARETATQKYVGHINTSLSIMKDIIRERGGDPAAELYLLMQQLGYDPTAPREEAFNLDDFVGQMFQSLWRSLAGPAQEEGVLVDIVDRTGE